MAKARAIIKRRKAVTNIHRITRTMQLIATAMYQKMFKRALGTHPYTEKISQLVAQLSEAGNEIEHPLLKVNTEANRSALIVLTSNRGLCGGYNANVIRLVAEHLKERQSAGEAVDIHAVGKKSVGYFKFLGVAMASTNTALPDWPPFADIELIANQMIADYSRGVLDGVYVAYTQFISIGKQIPTVLKLLPIEQQPDQQAKPQPQAHVEYEFSPSAEEILADLLPSYVKVRLYQCFTDAAVSEQIARMVAMKAATDAAEDMTKLLAQQYNRARQSQITTELLDIMGGAEALA